MWQLLFDFTLHKVVPIMQNKGLIKPEINIRAEIRRHTFFNSSLNRRVAGVVYEIADLTIGMWKITVMEANLGRIFVAIRFLFFVFLRSMSVTTTMYLVIMAFFTIPISYRGHRGFVDVVSDGLEFKKSNLRASLMNSLLNIEMKMEKSSSLGERQMWKAIHTGITKVKEIVVG